MIRRYISTTLKRKLRNNTDVIDYFSGDNDYMSKPKNTAIKDIDIADILGQKYRYRIDIGHRNIDIPLISNGKSYCCNDTYRSVVYIAASKEYLRVQIIFMLLESAFH